jgi:hypothetical protein
MTNMELASAMMEGLRAAHLLADPIAVEAAADLYSSYAWTPEIAPREVLHGGEPDLVAVYSGYSNGEPYYQLVVFDRGWGAYYIRGSTDIQELIEALPASGESR